MTNLIGFTIDGATSKDLDDAVWAFESDDNIRVQVSISDVAKHIPKGERIDLEAQKRIESKYYPERVIHMLPYTLSEGYLSLLPNQLRDVILVEFDVDPNGEITSSRIMPHKLVSMRQLSYQEADRILNTPIDKSYKTLHLLQIAALLLNRNRRSKGGIYGQQIGQLWIDESGKILSQPFHSQVIISELMITTNSIVAATIAQHQAAIPFRIHDYKDEHDPIMISVLEGLVDQNTLQSILGEAFDRAKYSIQPDRHVGLQLQHYCHFTSPIRRYADLLVHRIVRSILLKKPIEYTEDELMNLCEQINTHKLATQERMKTIKKERADRKNMEILAHQESLQMLDAGKFSAVLKSTIKNNKFEMIAPEVDRRLEEGTLVGLDLFYLLIQLEGWTDLKLNILQAYKGTLVLMTVISIVMSKAEHIELELEEHQVQSLSNSFPCRYVSTIAGVCYTHPLWAVGNSKKVSKQHAAYLWLEAYALKTLIPIDQADATGKSTAQSKPPAKAVPAKVSSTNTNYIALLNDLAQARRTPVALYEFEEIRHQWFKCTCMFWNLTAQAEASSKKDAKQLAAKALFEQVDSKSPTPAPATIRSAILQHHTTGSGKEETSKTATSRLFELAQAEGLSAPEYEFEWVGEQIFKCTCTFWDLTTTAEGSSKKEAKQFASERMLELFELDKL